MSTPAVGPTPLHIHCVPQVLSPRVEQLGHKVYHSLLHVAKAKNEGLYTSAVSPVCLHGIKMDNFTFAFYLTTQLRMWYQIIE